MVRGVAGGDGARGGVADGVGRSNRWKAVTGRRTARAGAEPNMEAASKKKKRITFNINKF